jgi:hypothetical protein
MTKLLLAALVLTYSDGTFFWDSQPNTDFYVIHCLQSDKKVEIKLQQPDNYSGRLKHPVAFITSGSWLCSMTPGYDRSTLRGEGGHSAIIVVP